MRSNQVNDRKGRQRKANQTKEEKKNTKRSSERVIGNHIENTKNENHVVHETIGATHTAQSPPSANYMDE